VELSPLQEARVKEGVANIRDASSSVVHLAKQAARMQFEVPRNRLHRYLAPRNLLASCRMDLYENGE
jgi:hypothetical protein